MATKRTIEEVYSDKGLEMFGLQEVEDSLIIELLRLFSVFCWVDGVVSEEEHEYVKSYIEEIYPKHFSEKLHAYFLSLLEVKATYEDLNSERIRVRFKYEERFYILFKLYELAVSDQMNALEKETLDTIRTSIGIYPSDSALIEGLLPGASGSYVADRDELLPRVLLFHDEVGAESSKGLYIIRIRAQLFCYSLSGSFKTERRAILKRKLLKLREDDCLFVDQVRIPIVFIKTLFKYHGHTVGMGTADLDNLKGEPTDLHQVSFSYNGITIVSEETKTQKAIVETSSRSMGFLTMFTKFPNLMKALLSRPAVNLESKKRSSIKVGNCFVHDIEVFDNLDEDWYCTLTRVPEGILVNRRSCPHQIGVTDGKWSKNSILTTGTYIRILGSVILWDQKLGAFKSISAVPDCLIARGISYRFNDKNVGLKNISFSAHRTDLIAVMGPSGSGKSTLLKLLNGSGKPFEGDVEVLHSLPIEASDRRSIISYTPQDDLLKADLTVYENLLFSCKLRYVHSQVDHHRIVHNVLHQIGLYRKRNLRAGDIGNKTLSGGERKRLNIGLELLEEKDIFLFDEPTTGLSSKDSDKIVSVLKQLSARKKIVFAVIHQPAMNLLSQFNKLLLLDKGGRLIYFGSVQEAFQYFEAFADPMMIDKLEGFKEPDVLLEIVEQPMRDLDGRPFSFRKYSPGFWADQFQAQASQ